MLKIDPRNYVSPQAIVQYLKRAAKLKTAMIDLFFPIEKQVNHPLPVIGVAELPKPVQAIPLVRRTGQSVPLGGESLSINYFEPQAIKPSVTVTAADLNNLKLLSNAQIQTWFDNRTERLRRAVRLTNEAITCTAMHGTIDYPVKIDGGGSEQYQVALGTNLSYTPTLLWDDASKKLDTLLTDLIDMETLLQDAGFNEIRYLVGKTAFGKVVAIAQAAPVKSAVAVTIQEKAVIVGGYKIELMAESYKHPLTGATVKKVDDHELCAVAVDADHRLIHTAIDDIHAGLQAMPLFIKVIERQDGSGYDLVGQSKPFQSLDAEAVLWADVCAEA